MKISYQGERVAFTLKLNFSFKFRPSNKALREFRKFVKPRNYNLPAYTPFKSPIIINKEEVFKNVD